MFLLLYHSVNAFLKSVFRDKAMHLYVLVLTYTICTIGCLSLYCRSPPEVVMYDVSCCREVEASTGCLQLNYLYAVVEVVLETVNHFLAFFQ